MRVPLQLGAEGLSEAVVSHSGCLCRFVRQFMKRTANIQSTAFNVRSCHNQRAESREITDEKPQKISRDVGRRDCL